MNTHKTYLMAFVLFGLFSNTCIAETESQRIERIANERVDQIIAERQKIAAERAALERLEAERAAKRQCERKVNSGAKIAGGTALGTAGGAVVGAAACAGFLGAIFFDMGFSYMTCLAATTAVGSAAGAVASNNAATEELLKCN